MWYLVRQAHKRQKLEYFKLFFTKDVSNIKNHTTWSVGLNDESANDILQLSNAFKPQQQDILNTRTVQEQTVTSDRK